MQKQLDEIKKSIIYVLVLKKFKGKTWTNSHPVNNIAPKRKEKRKSTMLYYFYNQSVTNSLCMQKSIEPLEEINKFRRRMSLVWYRPQLESCIQVKYCILPKLPKFLILKLKKNEEKEKGKSVEEEKREKWQGGREKGGRIREECNSGPVLMAIICIISLNLGICPSPFNRKMSTLAEAANLPEVIQRIFVHFVFNIIVYSFSSIWNFLGLLCLIGKKSEKWFYTLWKTTF